MSKTDKELAVEAAIGYMNAWNTTPHTRTSPVKSDEFITLIKNIHQTLNDLPADKSE